MTKDWKQVAKDQKREIAELKAKLRKQQQMYARLEKAGRSALKQRPTRLGLRLPRFGIGRAVVLLRRD
jgi:hypothetical protein